MIRILCHTGIFEVKNDPSGSTQNGRSAFIFQLPVCFLVTDSIPIYYKIFSCHISYIRLLTCTPPMFSLAPRERKAAVSPCGRVDYSLGSVMLPLFTATNIISALIQLTPVIIIILTCALFLMPACLSHSVPHACLSPHTVACF